MNREEARELLRISVGSPDADFREGQWESIDAIANDRKKLLVVQRTGVYARAKARLFAAELFSRFSETVMTRY